MSLRTALIVGAGTLVLGAGACSRTAGPLLTGVVQDSLSGRGIANAEVALVPQGPDSASQTAARHRVDPCGRFRLRGAADTALAPGYLRVAAPGFRPRFVVLARAATADTAHRVALARAAGTEGWAFDSVLAPPERCR